MLKYSQSCVSEPSLSLKPAVAAAPAAQIGPDRLKWNTQIGKWQPGRQEPVSHGRWRLAWLLLHIPQRVEHQGRVLTLWIFLPLYLLSVYTGMFLREVYWGKLWEKRRKFTFFWKIWPQPRPETGLKGRGEAPANSARLHGATTVSWRSGERPVAENHDSRVRG